MGFVDVHGICGYVDSSFLTIFTLKYSVPANEKAKHINNINLFT